MILREQNAAEIKQAEAASAHVASPCRWRVCCACLSSYQAALPFCPGAELAAKAAGEQIHTWSQTYLLPFTFRVLP